VNATTVPPPWETLAELALLFSDKQLSEMPRTDLHPLEPGLTAWLEHGALVEVEGHVRFFHDTLFDFVFARAFAEAGRSLVATLHADSQDLTARSMVRQVLEYQQGLDRERYSATMRELLSDPEIRFHLKDVAFNVLRDDPSPSTEGWETIEGFVNDEKALEHQAAWVVILQPAWFRLLDRQGVVLRWSVSDQESDRDRATTALAAVQRAEPARVAVILRTLLPVGTDWRNRVRRIIGHSDAHLDRVFFDLVLEAIDDGVFDDGRTLKGEELWYATHEVPQRQPDWAVELLGRYLTRGQILAAGQNPFDRDVFEGGEYWAEQMLRHVGSQRPRELVGVLLPFVFDVVMATAQPDATDAAWTGDPWSFRYTTARHGFHWQLLHQLDEALQNLARTRPASARVFTRSLASYGQFETFRYLLYRAWTANPPQFAVEAVDFLVTAEAPFRCGYMDSPYWVTRELIEAINREAPIPRVRDLEARILSFFPPWERGVQGRKERGHAQHMLLGAFAARRLSDLGRKKRAEWGRKFRGRDDRPVGVRVGAVGSPIPEAAARKMSNRDWLRAIRRYDTEENREDFFKGGAVELSRVLEAEAKAEPARFVRLALEFTPATNEYYVEAIVRALTDTEADVSLDLVLDVLRHFWALPGHPAGRWIPRLLGRHANEAIPPDVLGMVAWFATAAPDPERSMETAAVDRDPFTTGINTVRGAAVEGLAMLLWPESDRLDYFRETLAKVVKDPAASVRTCAALALRSAFRHDPNHAVELFLQLTREEGFDRVLGSRPVEEFLHVATSRKRREVHPVIESLLASEVAEIRQAGGRQGALAALGDEVAIELVERAFNGDAAMRRGVAEVAAANITRRDLGPTCEQWLLRLFDDPDLEVRGNAAQWIWNVETFDPERFSGLAEAFLESASYGDDEGPLLRSFEQALHPVGDLGVRAVRKFIEARGPDATNIQRRAAMDADTASKLAVRAYASAGSAEEREAALDVIDLLLSARVEDVRELLTAFD
jgi:hypothetical protein